jgi:hypothetical protein
VYVYSRDDCLTGWAWRGGDDNRGGGGEVNDASPATSNWTSRSAGPEISQCKTYEVILRAFCGGDRLATVQFSTVQYSTVERASSGS